MTTNVPAGAVLSFGKGKATAITSADIESLARSLGCHPADLEAIAEVESNGYGWFPDGRIKILFEKHKFYAYLPEAKRANAVKAGLARKTWISPTKGGYKDQPDADSRYALLSRALKVDREAAFKSISIGRFQIMGFNHKLCGHQTAEQMFDAFCDSEAFQLSAFAGYLSNTNLVPAIQKRDFDRVEAGYNGGGLNGVYAERMRKASDKLRAGKWANWNTRPPRSTEAPPVPPKPVPPASPETPTPEPRNTRGIIGIVIAALVGAAGLAIGIWNGLLAIIDKVF